MRISFFARFVAVALTLTGCLASPCAKVVGQSSPVKVSIQTKNRQHTFNLGEQIVLLITVENTGDVEAELSSSSDALDNKVSLTDATGNLPPLTAFGKKLTSGLNMLGPRRALRLRPGASKQISLDISQIYDLSRLGKYTISISRFVRSPRGNAKSNPLTIVILQKAVITKQKARPPDSAGARLNQPGPKFGVGHSETVYVESGQELTLRTAVRLDRSFSLVKKGSYTVHVARKYGFQDSPDQVNTDTE